ncbi:aminotransferase-like domain-containing protein [Chitiniphilus eburneus]|uniref:Putative 8-amino-7-oxononanoate synthase n=1 Tax=Chitiniphilus eburneus TaxID=2571148 RepID=A0A4U0PKK5_9NEIS|nr:PLP-dependent aminotransferase family protein [Chitiniphilus eburneus]TJZ67762.1 PLP-dependent aminotransferase family protein [Chitiniphilus eburneus]
MFAQRIDRLTSSLVRDILAAAQRPEVISFAGGLPADEALFRPDATALQALPDVWQYGQSEGEWGLRELVAQRVRALGLACTPEQVLILNGSQQGIDLVAKLMIERETPVLVEAPAYLAALQAFRLFGAECLPVAVDPLAGADLAQFEAQAARARLAYLTPTFQNPSGYCYSDAERDRVAATLDRHDAVLFEDDPYRDLSYEGPAPAPIAGRLHRARWVYQGSFSKTLSPGLRLGYLVAHPDLMPPLIRLKQAADLHSNRLSQHLVMQVLANGALDRHVASVLPLYRARRDAMDAALRRHLGGHASWACPWGGLFFWVRLAGALDTMALMREALQRDLALMPGEAFFQQAAGASYLRLNFSHAAPERIEAGIARLAELLREQLPEAA